MTDCSVFSWLRTCPMWRFNSSVFGSRIGLSNPLKPILQNGREKKNTKFKLMKAKNASSKTTEKTESFRGYLQPACVQPKETNGLQRTRHTSIQIVGGHEYAAKSFFLLLFFSFNPNQWNSHHYSRSSTSSSLGQKHEWTSSALAHTP